MTFRHAVLFAAPLALLIGLPMAAEPASAAERKLNRSVDSGTDAVIARTGLWNSQCQPRPFTLTIKRPPANGDVKVIDGPIQVRENPAVGTGGRCVGREVMGRHVVYRSKPGFHGTDTVVYEVVPDRGERLVTTVAIKVK